MPIPQEILAVRRPVNTVVVAYGKHKDRYGVRQRTGCRSVGGRNIPVTGPTIGHIIGGAYVPADTTARLSSSDVDLKDWADVALCDRLFAGMLDELRHVYSDSDALKAYCIALLRVCSPGIRDNELKDAYGTGFLSELYPGVALSRNTVSAFLGDLGKACSRITAFMAARAAAIAMDHHVLIDGTLKSDESSVNSLSDFSRKAKARGSRDISVLYAFDLEAMEPICSKCFPGNMPDLTSYEAFISENHITKGIIVADKGFPYGAAKGHFRQYPDLHYLNPVKRNSKLIGTYGMLGFTGKLPGFEGVTYRKEACTDGSGRWLYAYRDAARAAKEERDYLRHIRPGEAYDHGAFTRKQEVFGTVVLESDLDLPAGTAYRTYAKRWEIELVMRYYKSACSLGSTRVHDDYSVIGSEFCDFLASVLTYRLLDAFDRAGLLESLTYRKIMAVLKRAKKVRSGKEEWKLIKLTPSHEKMLQGLGLLPLPEAPSKRKRGRPRKS